MTPFSEDHLVFLDKEPGVFEMFTLTGDFMYTLVYGYTSKTLVSNFKQHMCISIILEKGCSMFLDI